MCKYNRITFIYVFSFSLCFATFFLKCVMLFLKWDNIQMFLYLCHSKYRGRCLESLKTSLKIKLEAGEGVEITRPNLQIMFDMSSIFICLSVLQTLKRCAFLHIEMHSCISTILAGPVKYHRFVNRSVAHRSGC